MAYSPSEKYPGAVDVDPDYQGGKFRDNNPSTTNNGSPLKAIDRNELLARDEAIMNDAGFEYSGLPDTPQNSQLFKAYKASLGNGANLLSNHNFLIQTPDESQPLPSATPTSYPPGHQIFSGVFANETTGITNLTYIDGRVSFSGGDLYFAVPNTGAIARLTSDQLTASAADFDGKPRTRGVSFSLVGDEYRVTVGINALEDVAANPTPLGSVKLEQGIVATGHYFSVTGYDYADSIVAASSLALSSYNTFETKSYYGGWAATINGPKGGATYFRDGTSGAASTIYADRNGFYDANGDGFSLPRRRDPNAYQFGGYADGVGDDSPALDAMFKFAGSARKISVSIPNGNWIFHTTVDLSHPGMSQPDDKRGLEITCGHEAHLSALDNTIDIFNVTGQRRFTFSGGTFKRARYCFKSLDTTSTAPIASATFIGNIFSGDFVGAIKRCYIADTSIGVYWIRPQFGTSNGISNQIETAVELTGVSLQQTNINVFDNPRFVNCGRGLMLPDSSYARLNTTVNQGWFETISGYAIYAGTNTKNLNLNDCYIEACGSASESPIRANNAKINISGGNFVALQNNNVALIDASAGTEVTTHGQIEYGSLGGRVFVRYDDFISQPQKLHGVSITDNEPSAPTKGYEELLFSVASESGKQFLNYEIPRYASTLTDTQTKSVSRQNTSFKGFVSHETEVINLVAQDVFYDIATVNAPNSGHSFDVYLFTGQVIQGVGHASRRQEDILYWSGAAWLTKQVLPPIDTISGFEFNYVSVSASEFKIQVKRTTGGASSTPFRALVELKQAANNMEGNEVYIL